MAHSINFGIDTSESDTDFENWGEKESGAKNLFEPVRDPGKSKKWCPETLQMQVFIESRESLSTSSADSSDSDQLSALQLASSMPSRAAVSHRAWRSSQLHPWKRRQGAVEEIGTEGSHEDQLVETLRGLSVTDVTQKLRAMPLSLAEKLQIRQLVFSAETSTIIRTLPCCPDLSVSISRTWRRCRLSCLAFFSSLQLWHSPMKRLSRRHGTGVLSYFPFLRTLLFLNLLIFIVTGLFVVFPQGVYPPPAGPPYDHELDIFPGVWLLTGTGYLSQSLMFYGYYSNASIGTCLTDELSSESVDYQTDCETDGYSIPIAYFFTIAIVFFVICIILVYSISKSFGKHFHVLKSNGYLAVKVFCSWDFKVSKRTSVRLQSEKISTQLKEQLSERLRGENSLSRIQRLSRFIVHVLLWIICLVSIFLGALGIHYLSEVREKSGAAAQELKLQACMADSISSSA